MQVMGCLINKPKSQILAVDQCASESLLPNALSRVAVTAMVAKTLTTNAVAMAQALACKIGK